MSGYLIDTNVLSEIRKGRRCHPGVREWFARTPGSGMFVSGLTIGEIQRGIHVIARRDQEQAGALSAWLDELRVSFARRLLPVDIAVADRWAGLMSPQPRPVIDALLGATALVHDLTLATRNTADLVGTGVPMVNPFRDVT